MAKLIFLFLSVCFLGCGSNEIVDPTVAVLQCYAKFSASLPDGWIQVKFSNEGYYKGISPEFACLSYCANQKLNLIDEESGLLSEEAYKNVIKRLSNDFPEMAATFNKTMQKFSECQSPQKIPFITNKQSVLEYSVDKCGQVFNTDVCTTIREGDNGEIITDQMIYSKIVGIIKEMQNIQKTSSTTTKQLTD